MKQGRIIFIALLLSMLNLPAFALEASLDRLQINQDETVTLSIRIEGNSSNQEADLSPLEQDFDIISTSQRSQIQIINGQKSSYTDQLLTLAPKRTGKLTIPALQIGKQKTQALILKVRSAAEQRQAGEQPDIFLTLSSEQKSVYVQAQLTLILRLHYRSRLQGGQLSDPTLQHAQILKVGKDKQSISQIDGETYQVLERRYAIFPERSGTLHIPAILFEGQVKNKQKSRQNRFDFFGFNNNLKTIRVRSNSLDISIKPQAADFKGKHWLPAEEVRLFSSWQTDPPVFKVGEPITRNITLQALGLRSEQLPSVTLDNIDGLTFYSDKAQQHNQFNQDKLWGLRGEKIAIRPSKAGSYTLPAISIPWWDTKADKMRYSKLAAETIEVLPASPVAEPLSPALSSPITKPAPVTAALPSTAETGDSWWFVISLICAMGWLLTALAWWFTQRANKTKQPIKANETELNLSLYQARQQLKQACSQNEANAIQQALLTWGKQAFPNKPPTNLQQLSQYLADADFTTQVQLLQQQLYADKATNWSASALWAAFEQALKAHKKIKRVKDNQALASLYPVKV